MIKAFYVDVEHFYVNCSNNLVAGESPNVQIVDFHDSVIFRAEKNVAKYKKKLLFTESCGRHLV